MLGNMIGKDAEKTEPLRMREKPCTGTWELTHIPISPYLFRTVESMIFRLSRLGGICYV